MKTVKFSAFLLILTIGFIIGEVTVRVQNEYAEPKDPCPAIKETVKIYEKKITSLTNEKSELEIKLWKKDSVIFELKKKPSLVLKEDDKIYIATGNF